MKKQVWMNISGLYEYDDTLLGVLVVTPELARLCLERKRAFDAAYAADDSLYELSWWDYRVDYVSVSELPEELEASTDDDDPDSPGGLAERVDLDGLVWFDEDKEIDTEGVETKRTDCDQMHATKDGVYWSAYLKHTDLRMETHEIPWDVLRTFLTDTEA